MDVLIQEFMKKIELRNANEPEFLQSVFEVAESIIPFAEEHPKYKRHKILERIAEPVRAISFRVHWLNDAGEVVINRGFRVQMNSANVSYRSVMRFHSSFNL